MKKMVALSMLLAFCLLNGKSYAQSQDDITKQFVGMWRLVSWPERLADGTTRQNPLSVAYLIYTDTGHMCYVTMKPNRPRWKSANAPTPEEALSAFLGSYGYCATVEIHAKEGFVIHHVEIDTVPNLVGTNRKRWFTFQGPNRVSLRLDIPDSINSPTSPVVESTLIWERVVK
jgi:lipocalin-like protein